MRFAKYHILNAALRGREKEVRKLLDNCSPNEIWDLVDASAILRRVLKEKVTEASYGR